jgi:DNA invertase Pin-like site-specific DNA recombinase
MSTTTVSKPIAIVYCRLSRMRDSSVMSLDSQEFAIKNWLEGKNMSIFKTLKEIGSAFVRFKSKPTSTHSDLKNVLNSCKGKTLVVYEPNRLSRNTANYKEIYDICVKNKHNIAIVTIDTVFDYRVTSNYQVLYDLIAAAQEESASMGRRIARTAAYKKSRQTEWGKIRNDRDEIIDNPSELKISRLIKLLSVPGSSVYEIKALIQECRINMEAEPFELVEFGNDDPDRDVIHVLPMGMSPKNIVETFKIYGIRKRKARWTTLDVIRVSSNIPIVNNTFTVDNLTTSMGVSRLATPATPTPARTAERNATEWINVWYNPSIGLPPNVIIPDGFVLPTIPMLICLPQNTN